MEAIRSYGISKKMQNQGYLLAGVMFLLFVIGFLIMKTAIIMLLVFSILKLFIAVGNSSHKVVKIFPKHFEIKLGIIAPTKHVKNKNFISIDIEDKKWIRIKHLDEKGDEKTIKIMQKVLDGEDLGDFYSHLSSILEETKPIIIGSTALQKV